MTGAMDQPNHCRSFFLRSAPVCGWSGAEPTYRDVNVWKGAVPWGT